MCAAEKQKDSKAPISLPERQAFPAQNKQANEKLVLDLDAVI